MKEILGNELEKAFEVFNIDAKCTYVGKDYNIYELTDEEHDTLCDISNEDWLEGYGFWRSAVGSNQSDNGTDTFEVNDHAMIGFLGDFREDQAEENANCPEEDIYETEKEYDSLLNYLCDEIGASTESNVIAVAVDLAKLNNMKVGELFTKYQGESK